MLGWAQRIIDFIFWAHMIKPIDVIKRFDITAALTLIVITASIGYIFGYIGAIIWNKLHACKRGSTSLSARLRQTNVIATPQKTPAL